MVVLRPLNFLLYVNKAEWLVLSSDEGLESHGHRGGDNRCVLVVCFGEFNCRVIDAGLCVMAERALSKPIFICIHLYAF